jgi:Sulfotransferase family
VRRRVHNTMRLHGKDRFAAKMTGPSRICFLSSIFSEPRFVNVIRDPRAVVESLLRVPFWRDTFRYSEPAWAAGLSTEDITAWKGIGTAAALAAVQWRAVLRTAREEARLARHPYIETRYEDFVARPHEELSRLFAFANLADDPGGPRFRRRAAGFARSDFWMATALICVSNRDDRDDRRGVVERSRVRGRPALTSESPATRTHTIAVPEGILQPGRSRRNSSG